MRTLQLIKTTLVVSLLDWPQDGLNYDRPRRFASYTSFFPGHDRVRRDGIRTWMRRRVYSNLRPHSLQRNYCCKKVSKISLAILKVQIEKLKLDKVPHHMYIPRPVNNIHFPLSFLSLFYPITPGFCGRGKKKTTCSLSEPIILQDSKDAAQSRAGKRTLTRHVFQPAGTSAK